MNDGNSNVGCERVVCTNASERPYLEDDGMQSCRNKAVWSVPISQMVLEFSESADDLVAMCIVINDGGTCEYLVDAKGARTRISDLEAHSYSEFMLKAALHGLIT